MLFKRVNPLKYITVKLIANVIIEKSDRVNTTTRCLFVLKVIFKSKFVSLKTKTE